MFVVAAGTDWVDGFWARRYGQVTTLGRILDPFVDKIIICGTFIFLVAESAIRASPAWMAVIVVGRELLVTALRSFLEEQGADFSAKLSGKLKMVLQCLAATLSLLALSQAERPEGLERACDQRLGRRAVDHLLGRHLHPPRDHAAAATARAVSIETRNARRSCNLISL